MKRYMKKLSLVISVFVYILYATGIVIAEENTAIETTVKADTIRLIDIAGKQRMLSQRIAKAYLYMGKKIATAKVEKELNNSFSTLLSSHELLKKEINDPEIQNLLEFVELSTEEFQSISTQSFTLDNAQLILDLSESMLEGSEYVVNSLKDKVNLSESKIVNTSGRQRMLAQRIAKYYIAYQAGIKDKNTIDQMNTAVKEFSDAHELLMKNITNTPEINRKLNDIDRLWKIVYKFYLNIEKGGLPLIVYNTTNDITKNMDKITKLYVELYK